MLRGAHELALANWKLENAGVISLCRRLAADLPFKGMKTDLRDEFSCNLGGILVVNCCTTREGQDARDAKTT